MLTSIPYTSYEGWILVDFVLTENQNLSYRLAKVVQIATAHRHPTEGHARLTGPPIERFLLLGSVSRENEIVIRGGRGNRQPEAEEEADERNDDRCTVFGSLRSGEEEGGPGSWRSEIVGSRRGGDEGRIFGVWRVTAERRSKDEDDD
ncbi:unnamed protein product [Linum trigynum]|uniref:Uncharacterized protein n=1 Tax=Linum trigynum TaxID=586398 RepID=A0AAV2DEJ0_9ROSI